MSAVSALAEKGITDYMISDEIDKKAGIYALNMYVLGVPFTMIVDDWMLMNGDQTIFGDLGNDGSVWGAIVVKAFAKYFGNYDHLT